MNSDEVLCSMPEDTKFFIYQEVPLAYSPETGMCWRVDSRDNSWKLITPGTSGKGKYTKLGVGDRRGLLHRIIAEVFLNAGKPLTAQQDVDHAEHADGSHWQDRLINLRICSRSENNWNCRLSSRNTSGFKGVSWSKREGKWQANIQFQGKNQYLGGYHTPEAAASAYDTAAIKHFGDFALTNEKLGNFNRVKNA